jgi:hypothetical protein
MIGFCKEWTTEVKGVKWMWWLAVGLEREEKKEEEAMMGRSWYMFW